MVTTGAFHGVGRAEVSLKYLPQPDFLEFSLPETHVALVTNEGSALTTEVVNALEARGNRVVLLDLPMINNETTHSQSITLENDSDTAIAEAVSKITSQYGPVGTFIHLHPHLEFQEPILRSISKRIDLL